MLFKVEKNDRVGRFAVASKDLKAGEAIFTETPFAYGPKPNHPPMCLGCYMPVDCTYLCSKCKWPACGPQCEILSAHKDGECDVFASAGVTFQAVEDISLACQQYECITPIRVLLAKEKHPKRWEKEVEPMESHNDKRKDLPIWQFEQINIVDYLRGPCKLDKFSEDLIHMVCGILEVNSFEAHTNPAAYSIQCLYPNLAILSHNCVSNISHSIANDKMFEVSVRAAVNVKEGEELFSSYTYSLWPTLIRRAFLKESKYFECCCARCSDPTELGTHMGTLKCSKCDNGVILSLEPLNFEATWKCTHCSFATKATAVQRVYQAIQADIDNVDSYVEDPSQAIEAREALYRKYRSVLHPRNAYHTILRMSLAQMYGKMEGYTLEELPDLLFERKIELCQELLQNLDIVEPGFTRTRGLIKYELHAPLLLLARNLFRNGCIDKKELRAKLEEVVKLLQESINILNLEPTGSAEYKMAQGATVSMEQLKQNMDDLVNSEF